MPTRDTSSSSQIPAYFTFGESARGFTGDVPGAREGVGAAGRDQRKGTLWVALPQDLKRSGYDGFQAFVIQGVLGRGKIASDPASPGESLGRDRVSGHELHIGYTGSQHP